MAAVKPGRRTVLRLALPGLVLMAVAASGVSGVPSAQPRDAQGRRAQRTRVLPWPGGDRLVVAIGADVRYVQGPDARVVITGPADEIADIVVDGGTLRTSDARWGWDWRWWRWLSWRRFGPVHIVVTAPHVMDAAVSGPGLLDLGRLAQDRLAVHVSGSGGLSASGQIRSISIAISGSGGVRLNQVNAGDIEAHISGSGWLRGAGAANSLRLDVSGSGGADLGGLAVQDAAASVTGSGGVVLAPLRSADVSVSGSGGVRLLTKPVRLYQHRSGSGVIIAPP